ncbi:MAG: DUF4430 domain-containing protein [Solirubrobacteraceae bacterium]
MPTPPRSCPASITAVLLAVAIGGCGLGSGAGTGEVTVTVTRNFGSVPIASIARPGVPGSETIMRLLQRSLTVSTRYGGGFVESINGRSGGSGRRDWFYYVNGAEAPQGAATTAVHRGDHIWWDLHDWSATDHIPSVVGAFPEPFVHGTAGKRYPIVLECAPDVARACILVGRELGHIGVPYASQVIGTGAGTDSIGLLVGTWRDLHGAIVADLIAAGPRSSGVYARFAGSGSSLEVLDPHGAVVSALSAGAGLVAATRDSSSSAPTWLVTGTDGAGVLAAAHALTPGRLAHHFALVVQRGGPDLPLPAHPGS